MSRFARVTHRFLADVDAAELFHRLARAPVMDADLEGDAIHVLKCMIEHQCLQGSIVVASPPAAGNEGIADADLTLSFLMVAVPRAADQLAIGVINDPKGTAGCHGTIEKILKDRALIAITAGMLLPDQRIGRHGIQNLEIAGLERLDLDQLILDPRL